RTRPAPEIHLNAGPGGGFQFRGRVVGGVGSRCQKLRQSQPADSERPEPQPFAARNTITEFEPRMLARNHHQEEAASDWGDRLRLITSNTADANSIVECDRAHS